MKTLLLCALVVGPRPFCNPHVVSGAAPVNLAAAPAQVWVVPDPTAQEVTVEAVVRAGSAYDRTGQEGMAALVARAVAEAATPSGVGPLGAPSPAGRVDLVVGREIVSVRLTCLHESSAICLARLSDALVAPSLGPEAVSALASEAVVALEQSLPMDGDALGREVLHDWLYEGHPYGHPALGRSGTLPVLTSAMARAFHRSHYVRGAVTVGVIGAPTSAGVRALRERLLDLPGVLSPELALQAAVSSPRREAIVMPSTGGATHVFVGQVPPDAQATPDPVALRVALAVVRRVTGALPVAHDGARTLGHVLLRVPVRGASDVPAALGRTLAGLTALVRDGAEEDTVAAARAEVVLTLRAEQRDPALRTSDAMSQGLMGRVEGLPARITRAQAVSVADVHRALQAALSPATLRVVVVTPDPNALVVALTEEPAPLGVDSATDAAASLGSEPSLLYSSPLSPPPLFPRDDVFVVSAYGRFR